MGFKYKKGMGLTYSAKAKNIGMHKKPQGERTNGKLKPSNLTRIRI
jgi:hypothetical protein